MVCSHPMTQVQGRGRAAALPLEERRTAIVAATLPAVPGPGRGRHHPGDRPGRRHRRGHDLPGLRRQDRAPRRRHRGRARPRAHRRRDRAPSTPSLAVRGPPDRRGRDPARARALPVPRVQRGVGHHAAAAASEREQRAPALTAIFATEAEHLSRPPADAARVLRGLTFACVHPSFGTDEPLTSEEIVAVLLDGIRLTTAEAASC